MRATSMWVLLILAVVLAGCSPATPAIAPAKAVTNVEASRVTTGQDAILYGKPSKDITRKDIKIKTH